LDHEYAGIAGVQDFVDEAVKFSFGNNSTVVKEKKVAAVQTLSGTGACRLAGELLAKVFGTGKKIYMPNPTWGNHIPIMKNAGLEPTYYAYFDPASCGVDFNGLIRDVEKAEDGSIFLLHACAHNPTGVFFFMRVYAYANV
jgi:aspartate aminotransferase